MFLSQPEPTPLDVRFRLFRVPVRVHPMFWVFGAFFGYMYLQAANMAGADVGRHFLAYVGLWLGWMFLSILVHEFGHITMARISGRHGRIILHAFGGLAVWDAPADRRWQRIAIALAGPGAGFLLFAVICLIQTIVLAGRLGFLLQHPTLTQMIVISLQMLSFMCIFWNLVNLIPIWPLDGGQVALEVFSGIFPNQGLRLALGFSFLLTAAAAGYSLLVFLQPKLGLPYPKLSGGLQIHPGLAALFLGLIALQNLQMLIATERERRSAQLEEEWS